MSSKKKSGSALYWDATAKAYQSENRISVNDFHYGPLLPGDRHFKLLPEQLAGLRAFEPGAGAGQNSIYLAAQGVDCVASDISAEQIDVGRKLAEEQHVSIDFQVADVDDQDAEALGLFDLVHSTYVLPFSKDPEKVIQTWRQMLKPGGTLIISTSHPIYSGEWLEVDEGEEGVFLPDYFNPPDDIRMAGEGHEGIKSRFYPVSQVAQWLLNAGLQIRNILEPEPLAVSFMSKEEIENEVPYYSESWSELYPVLSRVPMVMVFKCTA